MHHLRSTFDWSLGRLVVEPNPLEGTTTAYTSYWERKRGKDN
jgi:hypothetical protein